MKKLLEKMILFFVETKCFKLVAKSLFDAYFEKKNKTENEFQSMTASQGNQGLFFKNIIKAFYTVTWCNLTQFCYFIMLKWILGSLKLVWGDDFIML